MPASTGIDIGQHMYRLLSYSWLAPSSMACFVPLTMAMTLGSYTTGAQGIGVVARNSITPSTPVSINPSA